LVFHFFFVVDDGMKDKEEVDFDTTERLEGMVNALADEEERSAAAAIILDFRLL
jgi:hypothetical protein